MVSSGLSVGLHLLDGLEQLRQAFEREELALQRHQDRVRRRHRVDGEQIERRRTVDQHVGEVGRARLPALQRRRARCAAGRRGRAPGRSRARGRRDRASRARSTAAAPRSARSRRATAPRRSARRRSSTRRLRRSMPRPVEALPCGSRSTISTSLADRGERGAEIDRRRGLADAALLVGDRRARAAAADRRRGCQRRGVDRDQHRAPISSGHGRRVHRAIGRRSRVDMRTLDRIAHQAPDRPRVPDHGTTTMRLPRSVRLGHELCCDIPIFSGLGQFSMLHLVPWETDPSPPLSTADTR